MFINILDESEVDLAKITKGSSGERTTMKESILGGRSDKRKMESEG